jgi:hypothetical protein
VDQSRKTGRHGRQGRQAGMKFSEVRRPVQTSKQAVQGRAGRNPVSAEQPGSQEGRHGREGRQEKHAGSPK